MPTVKVLLVDDSLFIRNSLKKILDVPEIKIVDTAQNGQEAVEKNLALNPDLILLDIEMPIMNGLDALKKIMETNPTPVVMFSSLTQEGAQETIESLSLGALDFIPKQSAYFDLSTVKDDLIKKIVLLGSNAFLRANLKAKYGHLKTGSNAAEANRKTETNRKTGDSNKAEANRKSEGEHKESKIKIVAPGYCQSARKRPSKENIKLVCIGISTGGPVALQEVIPHLPANIPVSILIVQHMPPMFTGSLAKRLDQNSEITVVEAQDNDDLKPGTVYIGRGGLQMTVTKNHRISISNQPITELFKPSVNVLMNSVVDVYHGDAVGIIMTGMGNDGQKGLTNFANAGGYVIAQSIESCVIGGMPKSVIDAKVAHEIQPLENIAGTIASLFFS